MSDDNVSLKLVREGEAMLRKVGATKENFWIPISKSKDLALRVLNSAVHEKTITIIINYGQSIKNMIKMGKYQKVEMGAYKENSPARANKMGRKKRLITLFHFNRTIMSGDAISEIKRRKYRPVFVKEFLSIGKEHPGIQRKFPIACLGYLDKYHRFLCLDVDKSSRVIKTHWQINYFDSNYRFPAIRNNA